MLFLVGSTSVVAGTAHVSLCAWAFSRAAARLEPESARVLMEAAPALLGTALAIGIVVMLPLIGLLTLSVTHPVFGPFVRFRAYLQGLIDGTESEPCRIREKDELQDFCQLLNEATRPLLVKKDEPDTEHRSEVERRAA